MNDIIYLDTVPQYPPVEVVKQGERWIKHVCCDGARFHVLAYHGIVDKTGAIRAKTTCSEPDCIYNKPEATDD